jgi:hypothetical protein
MRYYWAASFLARAAGECEGLAGTHDRVIANVIALQNRLRVWIYVQPAAQAPADFSHTHVADGQ